MFLGLGWGVSVFGVEEDDVFTNIDVLKKNGNLKIKILLASWRRNHG